MYYTFTIWESNTIYLMNKQQRDDFFAEDDLGRQHILAELAVGLREHNTWLQAIKYVNARLNPELKLHDTTGDITSL